LIFQKRILYAWRVDSAWRRQGEESRMYNKAKKLMYHPSYQNQNILNFLLFSPSSSVWVKEMCAPE